ncbi:glutamate ABC transporter substrate-binding protein [Antrihabitans sp. YC2-6]|uniref:glutamate ABC transporter substrate-binding protein n=1 Tax=Antrihabitans sp. YC2-6 TaxID=2799498 RepID=UPI0018F67333|nr:glutamate ABC transporter substrate-binding protein [Antrihabitans sp. YC2-6]MBJ8348556.1 glutamate ABC transporter substrate-binding protein [Antrihabitans sp. YC2-6]
MSARMRRLALLLAVVVAAGASCSVEPTSNAELPAATAVFTAPPLPSGAEAAASTTQNAPPPNECGDPTASLRPVTDEGEPPGPNVDAIRARGRLIVGLDSGSNLFSFRNPVTGSIDGFDVEIAKEIAFDLFGDRERLEFRILSSADRVTALQERSVDLVAKTMTVTCARREQVTFSTVYFQASQRILVVKNSGIRSVADLAGKRVCVAKGSTSLNHIQERQRAATIMTVPTWADCLVVLQQRQVDAISTDNSILAGLAAQDPYVEIVGESISPEPYGIGITKGNDDLVRFVNATLERIRGDGTWNRIYSRWLTVLGPSPGPPTPHYAD